MRLISRRKTRTQPYDITVCDFVILSRPEMLCYDEEEEKGRSWSNQSKGGEEAEKVGKSSEENGEERQTSEALD